jgi:hypothetical protein
VGQYSSITIGQDGLPIISYYDAAAPALRVVHCTDSACAGHGPPTSLDPGQPVGAYLTSIAIGGDSLPIIAYTMGNQVRVAHCNDVACAPGGETLTTLNTDPISGVTSIAIGADGLPIIAYLRYDSATDSRALMVAHCGDVACAGQGVTAVDTFDFAGDYPSIVIGVDGLPIIAYIHYDTGTLRVAHCNDVACQTPATKNTVDAVAGEFLGQYSSITIGADGLPIISYYASTRLALKVAHCNDLACAGQNETLTILDDPLFGGAGQYTAITIGADGLPIISYFGSSPFFGTLRVAHCANAFCTPYFRRR